MKFIGETNNFSVGFVSERVIGTGKSIHESDEKSSISAVNPNVNVGKRELIKIGATAATGVGMSILLRKIKKLQKY